MGRQIGLEAQQTSLSIGSQYNRLIKGYPLLEGSPCLFSASFSAPPHPFRLFSEPVMIGSMRSGWYPPHIQGFNFDVDMLNHVKSKPPGQ